MIYLDNAATSYPKPERVYDEMLLCMKEFCANPGRAGHELAIKSGRAVHETREIVSRFFNIGNPMRVVFTKNATEALNIAINGVLKTGDHVITTSMEHNSVLRPLKTLEKENIIELTIVRGNYFGEIDIMDIERSIKKNTKMIICSLSSNVNGIIMPIIDIGKIAEDKGILFLVDASQGAGSMKLDVQEIKADMFAFPGHKGLLGPQGIGALYVRKGTRIDNLIHGGAQERKRRSGTENVAAVAGMGKAVQLAVENLDQHVHKMTSLRDALINGIKERIPYVRLNGHPTQRLANNVNFSFEFVEGEALLLSLDMVGIAASSGSACTSGSLDPSHVLLAIGLSHETAHGSLRMSLGEINTREDIDYILDKLPPIVERLRALSPLFKQCEGGKANV
ncbi:MAG TPA: aminotransferase class V-fold PLP-dependent enzyme [Bacillota bacterium]|nr:aminotransferase class V-fold PLP-dependent enzyme [Bacillota bacterium]